MNPLDTIDPCSFIAPIKKQFSDQDIEDKIYANAYRVLMRDITEDARKEGAGSTDWFLDRMEKEVTSQTTKYCREL